MNQAREVRVDELADARPAEFVRIKIPLQHVHPRDVITFFRSHFLTIDGGASYSPDNLSSVIITDYAQSVRAMWEVFGDFDVPANQRITLSIGLDDVYMDDFAELAKTMHDIKGTTHKPTKRFLWTCFAKERDHAMRMLTELRDELGEGAEDKQGEE